MTPEEYAQHDALALAELVRRREVSAGELVELAIAQIERENPAVNAVIHKLYERGRAAARGPLPEGPFTGVPFLLKDVFAAYEGAPLSAGSRFYDGYLAPGNSILVDRLLAAGLVVVGKTNLPELALLPYTEPERFGPTSTPYDLRRNAGGSSGGSAAAVAARMVPMASGGDGGGSIRMPAACCGLFGFKPSRGQVPVGPFEVTAWEGYSTEHVLTRSVRDSAACLDAIAGPAVGEFFHVPAPSTAPGAFLDQVAREPGRLRIAYSHRTPLSDGLHPDCRAALVDAVALLRDLGHELIEAEPSFDGRRWKRTNSVMMAGIVAADVRDAAERMGKPASHEGFEATTWLLRAMGEAFTAGEYAAATRFQLRTARTIASFVSGYDAWLTPTMAEPPPLHGALTTSGFLGRAEALIGRFELGGLVKRLDMADAHADRVFGYMPFTMLANAAGLPSMNVPLHWTSAGLPIGVMLTGALGDDAGLFRLAGQLERARPFEHHRPPSHGSPAPPST